MQGNEIIVLKAADLQAMLKDLLHEVLPPKEDPDVDRLLTVAQASSMLGVSRTTLWRWEKVKYLVPQRLGNKVMYKESDIKKLL